MTNQESPLNTLPEDVKISPAFTGDLRESIEDTAAKLHTLGDQLRLKLHLAGLEAKDYGSELLDSVDQMTQKLSALATRLESKGEAAEVQLWRLDWNPKVKLRKYSFTSAFLMSKIDGKEPNKSMDMRWMY